MRLFGLGVAFGLSWALVIIPTIIFVNYISG